MTRRDRIRQSLVHRETMDADTLDNLLAVAYWMGREEEAKRAGDKIAAHLAAQHQRAANCRYHRMAQAVVGKETIIYLPNYAGDYTDAFGGDPTTL